MRILLIFGLSAIASAQLKPPQIPDHLKAAMSEAKAAFWEAQTNAANASRDMEKILVQMQDICQRGGAQLLNPMKNQSCAIPEQLEKKESEKKDRDKDKDKEKK